MKTYIIYLSNNKFSVKMANETIKSLEFLNIEYELFNGVKGNEGKNILSKYKRYPSVHVNKWEEGTIGCLASHYILWDRCARQNEPFLVLEQDAILVRDPRDILDEIDKICHLDAMNPFDLDNENHFKAYNDSMLTNTPGVSKYPYNTFYGKNHKIIPNGCFRGTYGYIIKPEGAKDILKWTKKHGIFPSDACLNHHATNLQRSNSTYVRLNPFFKSINLQQEHSLRNPKNKI